jgi:superfamily II DNA helicase RecQ
VAYNVARLSNS